MLKSDKTRWGPARPDPTSPHDFTEVPGTQTEHLFLVPHLINSWKVYWTLGSNRSVNKEWAYLQFNLKKMAPRSTNNEDPKYLAWVLMDAVSSSEVFTNAFASCAFEPTSTHLREATSRVVSVSTSLASTSLVSTSLSLGSCHSAFHSRPRWPRTRSSLSHVIIDDDFWSLSQPVQGSVLEEPTS